MQHPQGAGEPPYGAPTPTMDAFSVPAATTPTPASSDVLLPTQPQRPAPEEFQAAGSGSTAAVNFNDDDMMMVDVVAGAVGGCGSSGNRWPREETLALIRIRSEMDAAFRNATLKAPVWEELSRRLAELGYRRSGKKCKEKFENVDKYYKRTKEGRTGRHDGKSYRFFSQLEALHAAAPPPPQQQGGMPVEDPQPLAMAKTLPVVDLGFLSMSSESESDDESDEEEAAPDGSRGSLGDDDGEGSSSRKLMAMFEGMMRQVTEKQDAMQRVFLETLEKWETERTEREEAWRRKDVARINREREQLSKERAAAASRDAALIAFLQRVGAGEPVKLFPGAPPPPHHDAAAVGRQLVPVPPPRAKAEDGWAGGEGSRTTAPSRWPKEEVQALIDLRMEKEEQYNDMGPKGPLWEEIAAGMQRIGYNRSAKRCKEKWENINKYFKKVKESNKRRPEDSKTCPYFHLLDAIYRKKHFAGRGSGVTIASHSRLAIVTVSGQENSSQREPEGKSSNDVGNVQVAVPLLVHNAPDNKVKGSEGEPNITEADETESDEMGGNYTDDGDDDDKMQYKIEFQKPTAGGGSGDDAPAPTTAAAATSSAPASNTGFLAVQ